MEDVRRRKERGEDDVRGEWEGVFAKEWQVQKERRKRSE